LRNEKTEEKVSLSDAEYEKVISSVCPDEDIKRAVVFSLYTGMRWCDVKVLKWGNISEHKNVPVFSIIQLKTAYKAAGPIHKIAFEYMGKKKGKDELVFKLPSSTWANNVLKTWVKDIGIDKKFTWHCCRHSFIMWAKRQNLPSHIIAGVVGHKGEALIHSTYNHYDLESAISIMRPEFKPMKVVKEPDEKLALVKQYKSLGFSNEEILQLVG
jgi:integrase/recombinase XerD